MAPRVRRDGDDDDELWVSRWQHDGKKYSESVARGIAILECFRPERPVRGIADVGRELGLHASTTHRYVSTLVALGLLEQITRQKYRLNLTVAQLGLSAVCGMGLREHSEQPLVELSRQSSYLSSLVVFDCAEALVVRCAPGHARGQSLYVPQLLAENARLPAYCTAGGKVLLAGVPVDQRDAILRETSLKALTPNTITSTTTLCDVLDSVKNCGLALDDREFTPHFVAVAAPVLDDAAEVIAAVTLTAPANTMTVDQLCDVFAPHIRATASQISEWMGFRRTTIRQSTPLS